jgi:hypothetical protein
MEEVVSGFGQGQAFNLAEAIGPLGRLIKCIAGALSWIEFI